MSKAYSLDVGELTIDLRRVDFAGRTVELEAQVGIGEIVVRLPADVGRRGDGPGGHGRAGGGRQGVSRGSNSSVSSDLDGSEGTLVLEAEIGVGRIAVITTRGRRTIAPGVRQRWIPAHVGHPHRPGEHDHEGESHDSPRTQYLLTGVRNPPDPPRRLDRLRAPRAGCSTPRQWRWTLPAAAILVGAALIRPLFTAGQTADTPGDDMEGRAPGTGR